MQLGFNITKNDSDCRDNGSIIILPYGGEPPYNYSLDGGIITQQSPIFQNLPSGTYSVSLIDNNQETKTQNVVINQTIKNTVYVVNLIKNGNNFNVNITPSLPNGTSVDFNLIVKNEFTRAPQENSATNTITTSVIVDGNQITNPLPITNNSSSFNSCDNGNYYITNDTYTWNITMGPTTTVSGTILSNLSPNLPKPNCYFGTIETKIYIDNLKISGCDCCSTLIQQAG